MPKYTLPELTRSEIDLARASYLHGACHTLAAVMGEISGWDEAWSFTALKENDEVFGWHAGIFAPNGRMLDVTGPTSQSKLEKYYGVRARMDTGSVFEITSEYANQEALARWKAALTLARLPRHPLRGLAQDFLPRYLEEVNEAYCDISAPELERLSLYREYMRLPLDREIDGKLTQRELLWRVYPKVDPREDLELSFDGRDLLEALTHWGPLIGFESPLHALQQEQSPNVFRS